VGVGVFNYEAVSVEFDDVLLTHLQIVIVHQFRHQRSFPISWIDALSDGNGRSSLWLTPGVPFYFKFAGSRVPEIDRDWIARLSESATSSPGLIVTDRAGRAVRAVRSTRSFRPGF
jgi:hypothetical protein